MLPFLITISLLSATAFAIQSTSARGPSNKTPRVKIKNGTYEGVHSNGYNQDFFLGVPYALPPVGDLRFRNPRSLNESWAGAHKVDQLSPECVGYGASQMGYEVSEDCLYLNVIRPSGYENKKLPVAVWIHGGAFTQGGGSDLRYNLSFIVERSVQIGHPIIGVSINYRLSAWGFLNSKELFGSGESNMGLRDQRLSLHWIQENIAAFGGDPKKVTLWGQSAGGASVGAQILAFNGRNDHLFRGAVMESGGPVALNGESALSDELYGSLLKQTGCDTTSGALGCLRKLPFESLNAVINTTALSGSWWPKIDGDFVARHSSEQLADGSFVKVPIIVGANTDEGTSFAPKGINTTAGFRANLESSLDADFVTKILEAYPDKSNEAILPNLAPNWNPPSDYGTQYRRVATYYGDKFMVASRRLTAQVWAKHNLPAYSYRFNAIPAWATYLDGATHFVEVAFAMLNLEGVGYMPVRKPPFQGLAESYRDLARLMSGDWVKFVATGDPNGWKGRETSMSTLGKVVPAWPRYATRKRNEAPKNFLYNGNVTSSVELDNWRVEGIALINDASLDQYDR
ncbi:Alpha/Beta hydrolase protein, partial [Thelonectria olida]